MSDNTTAVNSHKPTLPIAIYSPKCKLIVQLFYVDDVLTMHIKEWRHNNICNNSEWIYNIFQCIMCTFNTKIKIKTYACPLYAKYKSDLKIEKYSLKLYMHIISLNIKYLWSNEYICEGNCEKNLNQEVNNFILAIKHTGN